MPCPNCNAPVICNACGSNESKMTSNKIREGIIESTNDADEQVTFLSGLFNNLKGGESKNIFARIVNQLPIDMLARIALTEFKGVFDYLFVKADGKRSFEVQYAPGNEEDVELDDGTFETVEAGPWAVVEVWCNELQSAAYFWTFENAYHRMERMYKQYLSKLKEDL